MIHALQDVEASRAKVRQERKLPLPQLRELRELSFDFLAAFCNGFPRNQEALFHEFSTVLSHMAGVRKATTCKSCCCSDCRAEGGRPESVGAVARSRSSTLASSQP